MGKFLKYRPDAYFGDFSNPERGVQTTIFTRDMEMMLGLEESQIIRAISEGFGEIESIHYVTGIQVPCIEYKVAALEELGWVKQEKSGLVLSKGVYAESDR